MDNSDCNREIEGIGFFGKFSFFFYILFSCLFCMVFWLYSIYSFLHSVFFNWVGWFDTLGILLCCIIIPFIFLVFPFLFLAFFQLAGIKGPIHCGRVRFQWRMYDDEEEEDNEFVLQKKSD